VIQRLLALFLLPNLRLLVTAGANGIGAAMARAFHAAGARVHVCDVGRSALDELIILLCAPRRAAA
jgi:NAD(P)-dependent dehydrogenase (short-subunit alcohol dehydrogenase family)